MNRNAKNIIPYRSRIPAGITDHYYSLLPERCNSAGCSKKSIVSKFDVP